MDSKYDKASNHLYNYAGDKSSYWVILDDDFNIIAEHPYKFSVRDKAWKGKLDLFCINVPPHVMKEINTVNMLELLNPTKYQSSNKVTKGKLMYELVPKGAEEALAEICTFGVVEAGYEPGSWRKVDVMLYYAAARRHLEAWRQYMEGDGDLFDNGDKGSGKHHLKHVLTDIAFMLELTETEEKANEARRTD